MKKTRMNKMGFYALFNIRRNRFKYDIVVAKEIKVHLFFALISLVGVDIHGLHYGIFEMIFLLFAFWIFICDIMVMTFFHNLGVYKHRKKQKLAKETKTETKKEAERINEK
jgi:hypothetical protein